MKKIIGGLLVVALLTKPSILRIDIFAYEIYKAQHNIIALIKKYSEESEKKIESVDVDGILTEIDKNKRDISLLLKDKYDVYGKIQNVMYLKATKKVKMTEEQITAYKQFSDYYNGELNSLNKALEEIDDKFKFADVQKELKKKNSSYDYVYNTLKALNDKQIDVIYDLAGIIAMGQKTLAVL